MLDHAFMGRQPILDRQQKIVGYELSVRTPQDFRNGAVADELASETTALISALGNAGSEWSLGDKIAFINISGALLSSDFIESLPKDQVVLQLLEGIEVTPELLERCKQLRELGFKLALANFIWNPKTAPLVSIADYIKLDITAIGGDKLGNAIAALGDHSATLLADRVDTKQDFKLCKSLGIKLFQGVHFTRPETLTAKVISPTHTHVIDLLNKVRGNAEVATVEAVFKRDVALSFKLLRYINSVGFGLSCEIQSIRHALAILGYQQLYRWLTLLVVTADEGSTSPALMKTAITRGRLTELLGTGYLNKSDCDNLFIVGTFSMLDAMLEMSMDDIMEKLSLPDAIVDALLRREGIYGNFLRLAEACEGSDLNVIKELAESLQLAPDKVNGAHISALAWVEELGIK